MKVLEKTQNGCSILSKTKIAVAGIGYVGLSNAVLLAQHNTVVAIDINADRVEMINQR
ncbi:MAG: hypothetical protein WBA92_05900, partial [Pseudorhodobacter sp.]